MKKKEAEKTFTEARLFKFWCDMADNPRPIVEGFREHFPELFKEICNDWSYSEDAQEN